MIYKKIKPKKIYEEVTEEIHEMIRNGVFKPGEKLGSVHHLAENFQVGKAAIREALSALQAMGLVEMKQGEGTYIKEFDTNRLLFPLSTAILMNKNDIIHLLEVRKILEFGSVLAAANKRSEDDLLTIFSALEQMKKPLGIEKLGEADLCFHLSIAEASKNPILIQLMKEVAELMIETMKETRRIWVFSNKTTTEKLYLEHADIYHAILAKDSEKAQRCMMSHLEDVEKIIIKYLDVNENN
ncbi:FadR/GntR family transcriptional regulator [Neobacillus kokaensis]|uniref:HTH-type transcriptional regulator LutR n=1 Tax=Neobacillus kokaensis TaxID=2759023 RepID=A0ABQ3N500_9BACI|nr:FadR/GntR family transcriptional regulator [Neobacillus kokaensis]GHH99171.1 HTH-type transcriptional regulator LutR [Neobacillus kokaensis]